MVTSQRPHPIPLVASPLLWLAGILLLSLHFRLAPAVRPFAWPLPDVGASPGLIGAGLAALGLVLGILGARGRPRGWVTLGICLLWPALPLAVAWWTVPAAGAVDRRIVGLLVAMGLGLVLIRSAGLDHGARPPRRGLGEGRIWKTFHVVGAAVLLGVVVATGGFEDPSAVLLSLGLYPLYALVQLLLLLGWILPAWQSWTGGGRARTMILAAGTFALVHWPNPLLMGLTGAGMLVWSREYLRGRSLAALALSMGLLATLAAQGLPHAWTEHMRTGPRNVRQRAAPELAAQAHAATEHLPAGRPRTQAWLAELYPGILSRPATAEELDRWWESIDACRRGMVAWYFYLSPEYDRRFGSGAGEPPFDPTLPWADLPEPWHTRIEELVSGSSHSAEPGWNAYLRHLYREILERDPSPEEIAAWPRELGTRQRRRVVELLLERRAQWRATPFDSVGCATMDFYN